MSHSLSSRTGAPNNVVITSSPAGLELNQQLDDHFKKSIEHIHHQHQGSSSSLTSGGLTGGNLGGSCSGPGPSSSWRDKQLPKSFFEPAPSSGGGSGTGTGRSANHSRDNSTDSSGRYTQSPPVSLVGGSVTGGQIINVGAGPNAACQIAHSRAHSSPATLTPAQLSLPLNASNRRAPPGCHQLSSPNSGGVGPIPQNMARFMSAGGASGLPPLSSAPNAHSHQRFLSYDSAAAASGGGLGSNNPMMMMMSTSNNNNNIRCAAASGNVAMGVVPGQQQDFDDLGLLPDGWGKAYDAETGQYFYLNNAEKWITQEDPRKCMSANQLHLNAFKSQTYGDSSSSSQELGPLPPNWEEAYTEQGHKYFINHNEQRTTWFDPRIPEKDQCPSILQQRQLQLQQQQQQGTLNPMHQLINPPNKFLPMHQSSASAPSSSFMVAGMGRNLTAAANRGDQQPQSSCGTFSPNSQKRVQDLNQERRNYRLRQEEIMKQGLLMDSVSPNPTSQNQNLMDPCLSYAAASPMDQQISPQQLNNSALVVGDMFHIRQESSDSGVGMMMGVGPPPGIISMGGSGSGPGGLIYHQYNNNNNNSSSGSSSQAHTPENFLSAASSAATSAAELPSALNIAGIDLNFGCGVNLPVDMDTTEEIPQLNPNDLDQILNCRPPLRH